MSRNRSSNILIFFFLPVISVLFALLLFEVVARVLLDESDMSYGVLFGLQLPPKAIIPVASVPELDPDAWHGDLVVDGKKITKSDLWGLMREDSDVGWVPRESSVSTNRWWQTNNLGARSDEDLDGQKAPGKTRVLVFGDSFAQGSRLPQEETWTHRLSKRYPDIDIVNFGVDGYGMGQSLLRFKKVRDRISYDCVLFLFVPTSDLWRDVNTIRHLKGGWESFGITPRFVLEDEQLKLVKSPYENVLQLYRENYLTLTDEVREHVKSYDRFYFPLLYEDQPVWRHLISYKVLALYLGQLQRLLLVQQAFEDPDSEAWQVAREILLSAKALAEEHGANFTVAMLPRRRNIETAKEDEDFQVYWQEMVTALSNRGLHTIDLLPALSSAPSDLLDAAYDGTHYGPKASDLIAEALGAALAAIAREKRKVSADEK